MRYSELEQSILANFAKSNKLVPCIEGKPGGGKSSLARAIVRKLGIRPDRITEFNPSVRDPVDILGVPSTDGDYTQWKPPVEFWRIRDDGTDEPCALIIEELTDATVQMQNPLCRVILDRYAGELKLHPKLYIIATGNATEHKSGAVKMTTKLGNRMQKLKFDENLDDWVKWALDNGVQSSIINFLRWRPNLLSEFNPDKSVNATPRSWEMANDVSTEMPLDLYMSNIAGCVGEGPATEYIGFKEIADGLPDMDEVFKDPEGATVPGLDKPAVQYAFAGALVDRANPDTLPIVTRIIERLPAELGVMVMTDIGRRQPAMMGVKAYIDWAVKNQLLFQ